MARRILIGGQVLVTVLFISHLQASRTGHWLGWFVPMVLLVLVVINSLRPTRFVCWLIFAVAFFCFLILLSAFTLRWRAEPGFSPIPFYRAMLMYVTFIYVSLGQLKLYVGGSTPTPASGGQQ
jgi:hypothetical protein